MTSVMPQNATKGGRALAPANFRAACGLFSDLFRPHEWVFSKTKSQALSNAIGLPSGLHIAKVTSLEAKEMA
jgi:hypothetical protein